MLFDQKIHTQPGEKLSSTLLGERMARLPLTYVVTATGDKDVAALMALVKPLLEAQPKKDLNTNDMF